MHLAACFMSSKGTYILVWIQSNPQCVLLKTPDQITFTEKHEAP